MLYLTKERWEYLNPPIKIDGKQDLHCGFDIDTEYTENITQLRRNGSITITTQVKGYGDKTYNYPSKIYAHPDITQLIERKGYTWNGKPYHKTFQDFVIIDYLKDYGYNIDIGIIKPQQIRKFKEAIPFINIDLYGFFLVVDYLRVVTGDFKKTLMDYSVNHHITKHQSGITMERRIRTFTKHGYQTYDWVVLPWIITIDGFPYLVKYRLYDLAGLHGNVSYKDTATNVGLKLDDKELISKNEKSDMLKIYNFDIERYNSYSLGDLENRKLLIMNDEKYTTIYNELEIKPKSELTNLTIGRTVASIIESYIYSKGLDKKTLKHIASKSNADWLKRNKQNTTLKYLMKVDGGRCFNNRPLAIKETCQKDTFKFIDIDFSGAYSVPQTKIPYPIGNPVIIEYESGMVDGNYLTLRKLLKKYKKELYPGLWVARVSLRKRYRLEHRQDIFMSWFPSKNFSEIISDTDKFSNNDIGDSGWSKILTNEINLSILNHDLLEWIETVASEKQRKELMDNLLVECAIFYPVSKEVNTVDELLQKWEEYHELEKGQNSCNVDKNDNGDFIQTKKLSEPNYWIGLPYGEDIITKMKLLRKEHPGGTPLNTLYKLNINTCYGDIVSRFFNIGNVVLGNNITAMTRVAMWCMEKCFYGYQSITDGCIINLETIPCYSENRRLTGINTVTPHRYNSKERNWCKREPSIFQMTNNKNVKIETWLKETLIDTFPKMSCLKYYDIEIKRIANEVIFHGNANYAMKQVIDAKELKNRGGTIEDYYKGDFVGYRWGGAYNNIEDIDTELTTPKEIKNYDGDVYKMRSYKNEVTEYDWDDFEDLYIGEEKGKLHQTFLNNLGNNPNQVKRLKPRTLTKIIKPKDYKNRVKTFEHWNRTIGEQIDIVRLPLEISINQFPFKTKNQYEKFKKESEDLKKEYGQGFEMFFTDEKTGILDYELAVKSIDKAIEENKVSFIAWINKKPEIALNQVKTEHPHKTKKEALELDLNTDYTWDDEEE